MLENHQQLTLDLPIGTLTFLFTDIEGSTRLWDIYPEEMRAAMVRHDELIESISLQHHGVVVRPRGEGDSRFVVFTSANNAVAAALAIQQQFSTNSWGMNSPLLVRMALHTGEADLRDGDYYGGAVNRCARLRSAAHGGQILVSKTTHDLVYETLPEHVALRDLGEHKLKDLKRAEHIFQLTSEELNADFPTLDVSMPCPPTNVPVPRNSLIGRESELAAACNLILREDVALVTLTGPGGVGKSRLGIQIALELRGRFADGVYLVGLEAIQDPELVIPSIAKVLDIIETFGKPSSIEAIKRYLCTKQVLLLLDNFEHVLAAAPLIADLLETCPNAKMMVTSRAPLHLRAEKELPIPPLALPPNKYPLDMQKLSQYSSIQLFIERAQSDKPDFQVTDNNIRVLVEICRKLDGLPLAIELAAARIRMLPPQALLARLEHGLEVLHGGTRDLPERQFTLFKAIDWSYNLLSEDYKRLLRYLSVFINGMTFESAEAICNTNGEQPIEIFEGLERLINDNLLRPPEEVNGELRFKHFETIREFAHERLDQSGKVEEIHNRFAEYFLTFAERAEIEMGHSSPHVWLKRLDVELDNLRAAMSWMLEQGKSEITLRIAIALWRFWWAYGQWSEGLSWLKAGMAGSEAIPTAMKAKALTLSGWLSRFMGEFPQAVNMLQESLILWQQINDQAGLTLALWNLGESVLHQGDTTRALALLGEALNISKQQGDLYGWYSSLEILGHAAFRQGEYKRAVDFYDEALALAEKAGDDIQIAKLLNDLGAVYVLERNYERAEDCFSQAATMGSKFYNRFLEANISGKRGIIAMKKGDYSKALDLLTQTLLTWQELGDKEEAILSLEPIAVIAKEQRHLDKAARLLGASESQRRLMGIIRSLPDQFDYENDIADIHSQLGEIAFDAAWAEGSRMTYPQAVAYAVGQPEQF